MNWLTDRIRRKAQEPPPVPYGMVTPLDDVTAEQFAEDRPHLMRLGDMRAFDHAVNVVLPSGRSYRFDRFPGKDDE